MLEDDIMKWNDTRSIPLATSICERLYKSMASDRCTDEIMYDVVVWGRSKKINDPVMQFAKMNEEVGELAHELTRARFHNDAVEDALGDIFVTLIILADILGYDLHDCLHEAYETIKNRSGHTSHGSFIKDGPDGEN